MTDRFEGNGEAQRLWDVLVEILAGGAPWSALADVRAGQSPVIDSYLDMEGRSEAFRNTLLTALEEAERIADERAFA